MAVELPQQAVPLSAEPQETQPMESQVYQDYYMSKQSDETGGNAGNIEDKGVYETGETGHVDLANAFDTGESHKTQRPVAQLNEAQSEGSSDSEDELADGESSIADQIRSQNQMTPITPRIAGSKRDRDGNVINSDTRTPAQDYTAIFPQSGSKKVPGLSQLFQQTQADSSPEMRIDPRSDPIFERPSPEYVARRASPAILSSPIMPRRDDALSSTVEPRCLYLPLNESQRQRQQEERLAGLASSSPRNSDDEWDEDSECRRGECRRKRNLIRDEAMRELAGVAAPAVSRKIDRRRKITASETIIGLMPTESDKKRREPFVISSDHAGADLDLSDPESLADEYDELSQSVIPSDPAIKNSSSKKQTLGMSARKAVQAPRPASSPLPAKTKFPNVNSANYFSLAASQTFSTMNAARHRNESGARVSQTVAVANSQPEQSFQRPPRPVLPSSINSREFVSQSQIHSLSSDPKRDPTDTPFESIPDTSSIPRPPVVQWHKGKGRPSESPGSSPPIVGKRCSKQIENGAQDERISFGTNSFIQTNHGLPNLPMPQGGRPHDSIFADKDGSKDVGNQSTEQPTRKADPGIPETSPLGSHNQRSTSQCGDKSQSLDAHQRTVGHQSERSTGSDRSLSVLDTAQTQIQISPVKKMSDIGVQQSSQTAPDYEELDVNVLTADDLDFQIAMSKSSPSQSRPAKRQKRIASHRQALGEPAREINTLPPTGSLSSIEKQHEHEHEKLLVRSRPVKTNSVLKGFRQTMSESPNARRRPMQGSLDAVDDCSRLEIAETPQTAKDDLKARSSAPDSRVGSKTWKAVEGKPAISVAENSRSRRPSPLPCSDTVAISKNGQPAAPNRVLARFRGLKPAYHPATCLGLANKTAPTYEVRFDDETVDTLDSGSLKCLDLRIGDLVKVDIEGMRKETYQVCAFKDKLGEVTDSGDRKTNVKTDIHGHCTLILEPKQRQSLTGSGQQGEREQVEVSIYRIYVTPTLWPRLTGRQFVFRRGPLPTGTPLQTPSQSRSTPSTPSSRSRRVSSSYHGQYSEQGLQASPNHGGLFQGMAFAQSFNPTKDALRAKVQRLIVDNGGRNFLQGFHQLFESNPPSDPKAQARRSSVPQDGSENLNIKPPASDLGFVALIADTHSRRPKYMQALALNIPCLSGRWIIDSVSCGAILPWAQYLLPAGESSFLDGAIRSRTFPGVHETMHQPAPWLHFADAISHRPNFLGEQNVMLVLDKGKGDERRKTFMFLTRALGAKRVECVKDVSAAKNILHGSDGAIWDWVYVDESKVEDARAQLMGANESRNRSSDRGSTGQLSTVEGRGLKFKLASEEYVIQSLIMGALMEPA